MLMLFFRTGPRATYMVLVDDLVPAGITLVTPSLNHPFDQTHYIAGWNGHVTSTIRKAVKKQGFRFSLQFTQCKEEAANNLPALKAQHYLSVRLTHLQTSQSTETVMLSKHVMWPVQPIMFGWWQNSSRSVYFASQGKTGVYILPHEIIVTCESIFFVTVMSFSCSLKMFGWRQNSSMSGYFASWGKIDTAWVLQKYQHRILAMKLKNIDIGPKKPYRSSSNCYVMQCV